LAAMGNEQDDSGRFGPLGGYLSRLRMPRSPGQEKGFFLKGEASPTEQLVASGVSEGSLWSSEDASAEAFDVADDLEKGFVADEQILASSVRTIAQNGDNFRRCSILSEGSTEFHLIAENLDVLLIARRRSGDRFELYFGNQEEQQAPSPSASPGATPSPQGRRRPAFVLSRNDASDEWTLVQSRCECCVNRPRHLTCEYFGKGQQLAILRHSLRDLPQGKGKVHHLAIHVPPLIGGTQSAIWCPAWTGKDLGRGSATPTRKNSEPLSPCKSGISGQSPISSSRTLTPTVRSSVSFELLPEEQDKALQLFTRLPIWDPEVECLVLNFVNRKPFRCTPRNFMVADGTGQGDRVIFQHCQMSEQSWCLDFRHPLSVVQAFAIALCSADWA